jgi:uncharacterized protein YndB with AHSA1/START domain
MEQSVEDPEIEIGEQVRREAELETDAEGAWEAVSDPAMLERWLADEAEFEPVEGAPLRFVVDGEERLGAVERVVEGRELAFTWKRGPGDESLVRFELTPCVSGTRIVVTETRLSPGMPLMAAGGWGAGMARMRACALAVPA